MSGRGRSAVQVLRPCFLCEGEGGGGLPPGQANKNAGYLGRFEFGLDVVSGEEGSMDS